LSGNGISNTTTTTNTTGAYTLVAPSGSNYGMTIGATGFMTQTWYNIQVTAGVTTAMEQVPMVPTSESVGTSTVSGSLSSAVTGLGISGMTVKLTNGLWNVSGATVLSTTTSSTGTFSISGVPAGYYTGVVSGTGYQTGFFSVVVRAGIANSTLNYSVNPTMSAGQVRVVLSWGSTPADLDAHLTGPSPNGGTFHIYYANKTVVNSTNGQTYAQLDVDETLGYGPETVTILNQQSGTYTYYVHDYTNSTSTSSYGLATSGATVKVFNSTGLLQTFYVPYQAGTLWKVFSLNGTAMTQINQMSYEDPSVILGYVVSNIGEQPKASQSEQPKVRGLALWPDSAPSEPKKNMSGLPPLKVME
jgi:hypothetical protein